MTRLPKKLKIASSVKSWSNTDESRVRFFGLLDQVFSELQTDYFVVGATARDLVMEYVFGLRAPRATLDTDIAICVKNWQKFFAIRERIVNRLDFNEVAGNIYRLNSAIHGNLDVIPFGEIENAKREISWPPEYTNIMSLLGFKEAFEHSIIIEFDSNLTIRVASLAGLALLKLYAWVDRSLLSKDAGDFIFIMMNYLHADNSERLYNEHPDLISEDFNFDHAGARLLGRDISAIVGKKQQENLIKFIDAKIFSSKSYGSFISLVMNKVARYEDDYEGASKLMHSFMMGINDGPGSVE